MLERRHDVDWKAWLTRRVMMQLRATSAATCRMSLAGTGPRRALWPRMPFVLERAPRGRCSLSKIQSTLNGAGDRAGG